MRQSTVHFVGTEAEVAHHAAPLVGLVDYRITNPESLLEIAQPGDLAVFYSEHFDRFRDACDQLKKRNVATLYMLDGILEWRNAWEDAKGLACPFTMRPVLSHKVACIGLSQQRILNSWGNENKTEVVGIPRFDHLPRPQKSQAAELEPKPFRILVATAKTPAFTEDQAERVQRSLRDLKEFFQTHPTIRNRPVVITWRLRPPFADDLEVESSLADITGGELADQLAAVDAVISTASTLMLEAMLYDLPVALLDYHNTPAYVKTTWSISCRDHIKPVMSELSEPPDRKMLFQRTELHDAAYCHGDAANRMAQLIVSMQEIASKQVDSGDPLKFPAQILPPVPCLSSAAAGFDSKAIYPEDIEFSLDNKSELQSQLGHSRREILRLQRLVAVRESELAHAHEIFDKINNHPIVGPLVKLGRWWRDQGTNKNHDEPS